MAEAGWLNSNAFRSYPFLAGFQQRLSLGSPPADGMHLLSHSACLDFGCMFGGSSFFGYSLHVVYLKTVRRTVTAFEFEFRTTAVSLQDWALIFVVPLTADPYLLTRAEATLFGASFADCQEMPFWEGWLVTGDLTDMAAILPATGNSLNGDEEGVIVEPGTTMYLGDVFAASVNLANADRTRSENRDECIPLNYPFSLQDVYLGQTCLQGPLRFREGYNVLIEQDQAANSLTISAQAAGGLGEPCSEIALFESESAPPGRDTRDGSLRCSEVIRSINGLGGPALEFVAGQGVEIEYLPDEHRINIDVNLKDTAVGYTQPDPTEEGCESVPGDPNCGPA